MNVLKAFASHQDIFISVMKTISSNLKTVLSSETWWKRQQYKHFWFHPYVIKDFTQLHLYISLIYVQCTSLDFDNNHFHQSMISNSLHASLLQCYFASGDFVLEKQKGIIILSALPWV